MSPRSTLGTTIVVLLGALVAVTAAAFEQNVFFLAGVVAVAILGAALVLLSIRSPSVLIAILVALYGVVGGFLLAIPVGQLSGLTVNAGQLFLSFTTAIMALRLALRFALEAQTVILPRLHLAVLAFLSMLALGAVRSPVPQFAFPDVFRVTACGIGMLYAVYFSDISRNRLAYTVAVFLAAVAIGGSAVLDVMTTSPTMRAISAGAVRGAGLFGREVVTGTISFALLALAATILLGLQQTRITRLALLGTAAAGIIGITASFTRTAMVGLLVFGLLLVRSGHILPEARDRYRAVVLAVGLVALFGFSLSLVSEQTLETRLQDIPGFAESSPADPNYGSGRVKIWGHTVTELALNTMDEWAIGHGLEAIRRAIYKHFGHEIDAHNSYLNILYDLGVLGLAAYLFLILEMLRGLRESLGGNPRLVAVWRAYVVAYLVSTVMFNGYAYSAGPTWYTWVLTGAVIGTARREGRRRGEGP